jgi:hypothetical protein
MMMPRHPFFFRAFRVFSGSLLAAALTLVFRGVLAACPFCPSTAPTLSEELARADIVALGKWMSTVKPAGELAGRTTFEVLQAVKSPGDTLKAGGEVAVPRHVAGREGDLFLLTGFSADNLSGVEWETPRAVTETAFQYVVRAPSREAPAEKRLAYFLKYLEYPDPFIANDAYGEFARAPYADVAAIREKLSAERIREWLASPDLVEIRRGLYGLMLGLCGDTDDARFLERIIVQNGDEFRPGIDGMIGGYLLLTGETGLDVIDRAKLQDPKAPAGELFAAMAALRFFWAYGDGRISQDRLRQSMRLLLDRREVLDLVIADLARWEDWSVQDRLLEIYTAEDFEDTAYHRTVKQAILRYFLACTRDESPSGESPPHVATARKHLETLRTRDPELVRQAERFLGIE